MLGCAAALRNTVIAIKAAALLAVASPGSSLAQDEPTTYSDGRGGEIHFPMGDRSFADELVSFEVGEPNAGGPSERPEQTLGPPDFVSVQSPGYLTLGCGGVLVAAFSDNSLIDVPGIDLHIFEIGPNVEPTALAISPDGETWTRVGMISGGRAAVDIAPYITPGTSFRYVKLVDLKQSCRSYPGADIDAIGAVGSATKITLDSAVLFDSGEYVLKDAATEALSEVAAALPNTDGVRVVVAGHTDSVGSDEDNLVLSRNRAEAVAAFLRANSALTSEAITTQAYGESQPIASNETDEGRQKNRRVEIVVHGAPPPAVETQAVEILGVWESDQGLMELREIEGAVTGEYSSDEGRVVGAFTDSVTFDGFWIERGSQQACGEEKDGSLHWGRVRFVFDDAERNSFTATWSYCDADPSKGGWAGERLL